MVNPAQRKRPLRNPRGKPLSSKASKKGSVVYRPRYTPSKAKKKDVSRPGTRRGRIVVPKSAVPKLKKIKSTKTRRAQAKRVGRVTNPGKTIARGPIPLGQDLRVTDLDKTKIIEAKTVTHTFQWSKGVQALWDPNRKAFVWFHGAGERRIGSSPTRGGKTKSVHDAWSWRGSRATKDIELVVPSMSGQWRDMGVLKSISYRGPKSGRTEEYEHDVTSKATKLYRFGGSRPPWIWVVKGGHINVTKRGIIG